ncbi:MAG: hypothetical protein Q7T80_13265 [Methanoregula sp.]|nr:hypothetical protein [Methanoregula sp.]
MSKEKNQIHIPVVRRSSTIVLTLILVMLCCIGISVADTVPELSLTGPLTIGEQVPCSNAVTLNLTVGSTLNYTLDGTLYVTGPDGSGLFTAREEHATRMYVAGGTVQPVSRVIIVPPEVNIDPVDAHTIEITRYFTNRLLLIRDDTSLLEPVFTSGVYYLDAGSSMAVGAGRTVIMTRPLSWINPDVSYMREDYGPQSRIEILCTGHSGQDYSCTGFYISNRTTNLTVSRAFDFSVLPGTAGASVPGPLLMSSEITASVDPAGLMQYNVVASSSSADTAMNISSGIWMPHYHGGSDDLFKAGNVLFNGTGPHRITHSYPITKQGSYQTWASVDVTVPQEYATGGNPHHYSIIPKSEILYYSPNAMS